MSKHRKPTAIDGQFVPRRREMLRSPALRVLSLTARRILDRLDLEHVNHGGKDNGRLPVTFADLKKFGMANPNHNARGFRELCALGFIEKTRTGRAGIGEHRSANLFRITYLAADGKADAIVLDHSGAIFRHGFVEERVEWILDPERRAESPTHAARGESYSSRLIECSQCGAIRVAGEACPHCGFLPQRPPRYVPFVDGELGLVDGNRKPKIDLTDPSVRAQWHAMLTHIGEERGYKSGWVAHKYKERFGTWPAYGAKPLPQTPSPEVRSWVRSRMIAYAKRVGVA